jgi:GNAT superfamily N-acetyltransferase
MPGPIALRTVDKFDEPGFTDLVDEVLHDPDRRDVMQRLYGADGPKPVASGALQVRIGAFDGDLLVGWTHGYLQVGGLLYAANSGVRPGYQRQGIYTRLVAALEDEARALHCLRIGSHHRAANSAVLIAKMKAGYTIVGTEFNGDIGLLVKMVKHLDPRRDEVFLARVGMVEATARLFGRAPEQPLTPG